MIRLPIFISFEVRNYGLFPGDGNGIQREFEPGLCLIAGINGLGKTTLLTMLLRALTGPVDLTGDGLPEQLDAVLPPKPVDLRPRNLRFFAQRVADDAKQATIRLNVRFGQDTLQIRRSLADLKLLELFVKGVPTEVPGGKKEREELFQQHVCELFGLSSFVDVLLILHHVIFFKETRPGALWDENAQRQILRALFLEKSAASRVAELEREVQSADSRARNIGYSASITENELAEAQRRQATSPKLQAQLTAEQKVHEADLKRLESLELSLSELDEARKLARLEHEKGKLQREEAEGAVERLKYAALLRLFPKMEDAAKLVILKALATGECLVCGANTEERKQELEELLAQGYCPVCGAEPERQAQVVAPYEVERVRVKRARVRAELARTQEVAAEKRLEDLAAKYDAVLSAISDLRKIIEDREFELRRLSAELPPPPKAIKELQQSLDVARRSQREAEAERAAATKQLRSVLKINQTVIIDQSDRLSQSFSHHVTALLAEEAQLVRIEGSAKLTQSKIDFAVPAFQAEMSASNRPGLARRTSPSDVSESERELIDLAFRLALIDVATKSSACSLLMETPESSLDELAMERVGSALHRFARRKENRLIVTSNLTNAGMISAMFGGPTSKTAEIKRRRGQIVNLLSLAAPNQALERDGKKYARILEQAIKGDTSGPARF